MKGIKNRGSQAHRVRTKYTRNPKHKGLVYDRNVCTEDTDDEPEPEKLIAATINLMETIPKMGIQ